MVVRTMRVLVDRREVLDAVDMVEPREGSQVASYR